MRLEEELAEAMQAHVVNVHATPMMGKTIRRRHRTHKIWFRTAGAALVTAAVAGAVPTYLALNAGPAPVTPAAQGAQPTGDAVATVVQEVVVPDVTGLKVGEATEKLQSAGLRVALEGPTIEPDWVTREQSPAGGAKALEGSTVTLTAAEAPDPARSATPDGDGNADAEVSQPQDLGDLGDGREFGGIRIGYLPEGLVWGKWSVKDTFGKSSYSTSWRKPDLAPGLYSVQAIVYKGGAAAEMVKRLTGYRKEGVKPVEFGDTKGYLVRMGEAGRLDDNDELGTPTIVWMERPGLAVELMMSPAYLEELGKDKTEDELKKVAASVESTK
ncbi:PASTA domain-containing protein [Streptosporangium sp. NPDC000396]|uniref:PASTA domain-containing protein n=1 Tax=Streptosporangium sp. NPDC000396 TaxID=3366185 RepID=UPI0036C643C8